MNGCKNPLVEQKSFSTASARDLKLGSLCREPFELICLHDQHFHGLAPCNLSGAIYVSTVKNWVCYSKTALKAGNRTVEEEFKVVTIKAIKARYSAPVDTDSGCLLWRQLVKTVKVRATYTKKSVLMTCKRSIARQEKSQPQHYALTEASLVLVSSDADFATFWMMGAMFVGPYSCSLGRQLW